MKIAIDCRWIPRRIFGIGAYTRDIVTHLARIDHENEYVLIFNDPEMRDRILQETGAANAGNFTALDLPYGVFSIQGQLRLPSTLRRNNIDIFHSPNYMIPFAAFPRHRPGRIRCVVTIHDLIPMIFRHHAPRSRKSRMFPLYRLVMHEVAARADVIVTDSLCSAADITKHLGVPESEPSRIAAIYLGVSEMFTPAPPGAGRSVPPSGARRETYLDCSPGARNILYAGRMDPYKNLATLIKAVAAARGQTPFPISLTIVGGVDPRYPEAPDLVKQLDIGNAVRWTGYVPDEDLAFLYRNCDLLVHPSRYEGFGLTVAQAMASGTPVIASNAGPLPEVLGDAGIMLDPDDLAGFTRSIIRVLSDPELARTLAQKGIERAARFKWEHTAAAILGIYRGLEQ